MEELKLSECKWPEVYISIPKEIAKESLQYQNNMTAVEWLVDKLDLNVFESDEEVADVIEQAKEMEKEQIVTAHYQGYRNDIGTTEVSEQYYNETFKSE